MSEDLIPISVWWDINSCPVPSHIDPRLAGPRIRSSLKKSGYTGPVGITAVGNLERTPRPDLLETLFSSGINLQNISSCYCVSQLHDWRRSAQPPANLLFICSPTTLEVLSESIFHICDEGYTILVAHPGRKRGSEWLWKSFLSVVSREWIWKSFLEGSTEEEALEHTCRKTGYVSCFMCEFYGYSFEDLTTHFSSDEHLEELSYRVPQPKGSESESESETEHVVEEEEPQMCAKKRA